MKTRQRIRDRVFSDFLMGSRLDTYEAWLTTALRAEYQVSPVGVIWRMIEDGGLDPGQRHLALRHDVDTDPGTAAAMWQIERRLGIRSSYFFRLSTLDPRLMADIEAAGSEASYHYEEIATIAKRRGLRSREEALLHLPEARAEFAANIGRLRATTGLPMRVVASHGDFVNERLGLANCALLEDPEFRRSVGVELETYDPAFLEHLPSRHTDVPHPRYWDPADPLAAVHAGEPVISVLVHPRHWRTARMVNVRDDLQRLVEGLRYDRRPRTRGEA